MSFASAFIGLILACALSAPAQAQVLQILHTNDMHSWWEHDMQRDLGGYARIKALMDKLEDEGNKKGWITIRLDGGDFSDGNINYLTAGGVYSFQLIKLMNYDVVALGNHEYVTGEAPLVERAAHVETRLPLVASNFFTKKDISIQPGRIIYRGGLKIAVAGATTDDKIYNWLVKPAEIVSPEDTVDEWLSQQHADIRIALTHIGLADDEEMVRHSKSIDVVIGAHSHHTLHKPEYILNQDNKIVPVAQAGYHGRYVGQMVIKLPVWGTAHVEHYELHPVTLDLPEDPVVKAKVDEGTTAVANDSKKLNDVVARADATLYSYLSQGSFLADFMADSMKEVARTDVAFDIASIYGLGVPAGDLTVKDIYNLQPHTFDINSPGWHVFTTKVKGNIIRKMIGLATWSGWAFMVSGIEAHLNELHRIEWIKVNGQPLDPNKEYTLATSEGAIVAVSHLPQFVKYLPPPYHDTGVLVREMLLQRAKELKVFPAVTPRPRVTWPGSQKPIHNRMCGECAGG